MADQTPEQPTNDNQPEPVAFDAASPHHSKPRLRPVRPVPLEHKGQRVMGLRDAQMISERMVVTGLMAQFLLGHMDGETDIPGIAAKAREQAQKQNVPPEAVSQITEEPIQTLVGQLDGAGMLEGPRFDALLADMREKFDSKDTLPPSVTADMADALAKQSFGDAFETASDEEKAERGAQKMRTAFDDMIEKALEKADNPSWDTLPKAVFVPNSDYQRGWLNYASVYGRMRVCDRPDRVVVLAPNAFRRGTGVTACDKGIETPLGTCHLDNDFLEAVKSNLGPQNAEALLRERFDHERDASVELQVPWVQHVFTNPDTGEAPKVVGFLMHDHLRNNGAAIDNEGVSTDDFINALTGAIANMPGNTLVVCATELAHVGPAFGDQVRLAKDEPQAEQFRQQTVQTDQGLLKSFSECKLDEMLNQLAWSNNGTRWSGVGPMIAAARATNAESITLINYMGAADQQGMSMTTTFAAAAL